MNLKKKTMVAHTKNQWLADPVVPLDNATF
jgi:hypothetical protein